MSGGFIELLSQYKISCNQGWLAHLPRASLINQYQCKCVILWSGETNSLSHGDNLSTLLPPTQYEAHGQSRFTT